MIPSHFGDIMSLKEESVIFPAESKFNRIERILLTANGNLQRILCAFFNATVLVKIIYNNPVGDFEFDRQVILQVNKEDICTANSKIIISDPDILDLIKSNTIGIGQLFRHLNILPEFKLHSVGKADEEFWREYTLESKGISCQIREVFRRSAFN